MESIVAFSIRSPLTAHRYELNTKNLREMVPGPWSQPHVEVTAHRLLAALEGGLLVFSARSVVHLREGASASFASSSSNDTPVPHQQLSVRALFMCGFHSDLFSVLSVLARCTEDMWNNVLLTYILMGLQVHHQHSVPFVFFVSLFRDDVSSGAFTLYR
jgi:hypothetical protein